MSEEITPWLLKFESGKKWYNTFRSEATKALYIERLEHYCKTVAKNPDDLINLKIEGLKNINSEKEWQAEGLLDNYLYSSDTNLTIHLKSLALSAVKSFYKANWRDLNPNAGSKIELPEPKRRTPKLNDVLAMEDAVFHKRDKAILWFLESAPFRQGTLTKLLWKDIKSTETLITETREEAKGHDWTTLEDDAETAKAIPYYLVIEGARMKGGGKGKYKGVKQIGFLHAYAAEKLEKYKQELMSKGIAISPDSNIFVAVRTNPYNRGKGDKLNTLENIFVEASNMAWHDMEKKRFSAQDMRDILQSALESAKIHPNIAAPLLGHKVKGVDKHYSSHDLMEFLLAYKSALPWLVPQTVEQVKAESEKKLSNQEKTLTHLEYENTELKDKINNLRAELKEKEETNAAEIEKLQKDYKTLNERIEAFVKHHKTL